MVFLELLPNANMAGFPRASHIYILNCYGMKYFEWLCSISIKNGCQHHGTHAHGCGRVHIHTHTYTHTHVHTHTHTHTHVHTHMHPHADTNLASIYAYVFMTATFKQIIFLVNLNFIVRVYSINLLTVTY